MAAISGKGNSNDEDLDARESNGRFTELPRSLQVTPREILQNVMVSSSPFWKGFGSHLRQNGLHSKKCREAPKSMKKEKGMFRIML